MTTIEEAQDLIVHMREALVAVYSDKRKQEAEIDSLKVRIEELIKEKVGTFHS